MPETLEASARAPTAWFGVEQSGAVEDFWRVYDADFEEISAATLRFAEGHPELAEIVRGISPEQIRAENVQSRERLRRAIAGDWSPYEAALRAQGAAYARLGISFGCWSDLVRDFHGQLIPRLVQAYAREPERLSAALLASNELADRALAVLADEYIQTKQTLLMEAEARERDRAEDERKRTEEMARRSAELAVDYEKAQAATRLKSEFLANMSHELRTPLNSIIGFAELLHDGVVEPTSPEHEECLRDILTSGRHLLQLINDVLDLAKVESGKIEFRPELVDLAKVVSEVTAMLRTISAGKAIRIDTDIDRTLNDLQLDPARLKQVLYNYLSNALKFTPPGGRVIVRARDELDAFWIEVEDTGIGIALEDLDRLFVEFQQLDAGSAKEHGGTGLGLALTKRIVEAQGGRVGVRSKVGVGSVFYATLPRRVVGLAAAPIPVRSRARLDDSAPRVLVVEDDARDQALVVAALESAGYAIETVVTGRQAIERCEEESFDAITLDLFLPDMSGLDVLAAIRSQGKSRDARVIVVTVVADRGLLSALAVDDLLPKPVDEDQLLHALARVGVAPDRGGHVLIIDDDAPSRRLMQASLSRHGYVVTCEPNGQRGLAAVARELPDAVVLDLLMPEMDGFEFLSRFRADGSHKDIPVLIWTMKNLSEADEARLRGSQSIVFKGGGPAAIVDELRSLVRVNASHSREEAHGR